MGDLTLRDGSIRLQGQSGHDGVMFPDNTVMYSALKRVKGYASNADVATINWNECEVAKITLTGNTTFVFVGGNDMQTYLLEIKQGSTEYGVTLPITVKFGIDVPEYVASESNKRDKLLFMRSGSENTYDLISASKGF